MSEESETSQLALPARTPGPIVVNRDTEMAWSGIGTFMKLPVCLTPEDLRAGGIEIAIGGAPWEGTATGRTVTHLGPRAIRECDYLGGDHGTTWPSATAVADAYGHGKVGMDVVEVSPPYDVGNNITALFAHRCVLEAITGTAMRKLGMTEPNYIDPRSAGSSESRSWRET